MKNEKQNFSESFKAIMKKYRKDCPFIRLIEQQKNSKRKQRIVVENIIKKETVKENVLNFFLDRQSKVLEEIGDVKENYDEILDRNADDVDEKDPGILKKFEFLFEKPKENLVEEHRKRAREIKMRNKDKEIKAKPLVNVNRSLIIQNKDILPLIICRSSSQPNMKVLEAGIVKEVEKNLKKNIKKRKFDKQYKLRLSVVLHDEKFLQEIKHTNLLYPLRTAKQKLMSLESEAERFERKADEKADSRKEEYYQLEKRYRFLLKKLKE